jgi:hypothetical protein
VAELMGTAFLVKDKWYLRYLDGGGAMVPIEASAAVKDMLRDGAMVQLEGYMSTDGRGCAKAANATKAKVIG